MNISKVLVIGADGFLGEHIVRHLVNRHVDVYAAVSRPQNKFLGTAATYSEDDLAPEFLRQLVNRIDAVIFSAGWGESHSTPEWQRRQIQLTKTVFAAIALRPPIRVVYTSSLAGSHSDLTNKPSESKRTSLQCEQIALDSAKKGNITILDPGYLLGPGAFPNSPITTTALILRFCQQRRLPRKGGHSFCDVRDVAKAYIAALSSGGDRYCVAGQNLSSGELERLLVKMTGLSRPRLSFRQHSHTPLISRSADSQKAIDELGYTITPLETTILDTIKYFVHRGVLSEEWRFFEDMTPDNAQALLFLRQLARSHQFSRFLLARIPEIYRICVENRSLNAALMRSLTNSQSNDNGKEDLTVFNQLFEYLYFASDDFLSKVV